MIQLNDCKLITSKEYMELDSPVFQGQTRPNKDGIYYMVFECEGRFYKTQNQI
jgi:hypothetical protein